MKQIIHGLSYFLVLLCLSGCTADLREVEEGFLPSVSDSLAVGLLAKEKKQEERPAKPASVETQAQAPMPTSAPQASEGAETAKKQTQKEKDREPSKTTPAVNKEQEPPCPEPVAEEGKVIFDEPEQIPAVQTTVESQEESVPVWVTVEPAKVEPVKEDRVTQWDGNGEERQEVDAPIVPACAHDFQKLYWPNEATCTKEGAYILRCTKCGQEDGTGTHTEAVKQHQYVAVELAHGNCVDCTRIEYTCAHCGINYIEAYVEEGEHEWAQGVAQVWKEDTHTIEEIVYQYCTRCHIQQ